MSRTCLEHVLGIAFQTYQSDGLQKEDGKAALKNGLVVTGPVYRTRTFPDDEVKLGSKKHSNWTTFANPIKLYEKPPEFPVAWKQIISHGSFPHSCPSGYVALMHFCIQTLSEWRLCREKSSSTNKRARPIIRGKAVCSVKTILERSAGGMERRRRGEEQTNCKPRYEDDETQYLEVLYIEVLRR